MGDFKDIVEVQIALKKAGLVGEFYDELTIVLPDILTRMSKGELTASDAMILNIVAKVG